MIVVVLISRRPGGGSMYLGTQVSGLYYVGPFIFPIPAYVRLEHHQLGAAAAAGPGSDRRGQTFYGVGLD